MQFNASRRGAIIASLMQYLSSFRRLVSAERAVDKSLSPPTYAASPSLPTYLHPSSNYPSSPPPRAVCGGHFSGAELHPPNCNFVGHRFPAALALFLPTPYTRTLPPLLRKFLFPLLVSSRG